MTENEILEEYNKIQNEFLTKRKITKLIICDMCKRTGKIKITNFEPKLCFCPHCDHGYHYEAYVDLIECDKCKGTGYVNATT